jgi:hypothetical protein
MLSKEQWDKKIKSLVPSWVTKDTQNSNAMFSAIAEVLFTIQNNYQYHLKETYIEQSSKHFLNSHGLERSLKRIENEDDHSYATRIRKIVNKSNKFSIQQIIDNFLITGKAIVFEHIQRSNFLNRKGFLNRNLINYEYLYNTFTLLVDYQNTEKRDDIYNSLVNAINSSKAVGVLYRIIERSKGV